MQGLMVCHLAGDVRVIQSHISSLKAKSVLYMSLVWLGEL